VEDSEGRRLAKRDRGTTIRDMRKAGTPAKQILAWAEALAGDA
jgi:hypothetical protein